MAAVVNENTKEIRGKSTEEKPTTDPDNGVKLREGSIFFAYDTGVAYMFNGTSWVEL